MERAPQNGIESGEKFKFRREQFEFQFAALKKIQRMTEKPVLDLMDRYTNLLRIYSYAWTDGKERGKRLEDLTEENLVDRTYANYSSLIQGVRRVPREFGCFDYEVSEKEAAARIHFANAERDEIGPLSAERMENRKAELARMLADIKAKHVEVTEMRGSSWLYNLESYRRLFPESYTKELVFDADPKQWQTGGIWGQFVDSDYRLRTEAAEQFLSGLDHVDERHIWDALPYKPLKARGPISDFYKLYGIE